MEIVPCGTEHFEELISFVTRLNEAAAHHIGYFGVGEADVRASLAECIIPPARGFLLAYENEKTTGILGVDADPEIGRAWLYGPIVEHADWQKIADQLLSAVLPMIPAGIREHELFCDVQNTNLREFASRHGFPPRSENAIFHLLRDDYNRSNKDRTRVIAFQENYFEQFEHMHNQIFPGTYFTARQVISKQDEKHRLFIAVEKGRLLGYLFCKTELESESGYVDFIGVDSSTRNRGIGTDLLASGLDWMLAAPSIQQVSLTVNADNEAARRLYQKFGFTAARVMRSYRKRVL